MMRTVSSTEIMALAQQVFQIEAQGIAHIAQKLNHDFIAAIDLILQCTGRVVVLGIGKSGHIAHKIAATLASTGTPAFFVHPSEASHGDLGMITRHDVVIAISNSGETAEVLAILPMLKRFSIPVISITGNPVSTLAKIAEVHLDIGVEQEACPLGLAPTASTTATLVMGDALAIAILDCRGFTAEDFALSHPGGALGKRLLIYVEDLMHGIDALPRVAPATSLLDALTEMGQKNFGITAVVDAQGILRGAFSDGDVRRALRQFLDPVRTPIDQLMSLHPKTIQPRQLAAEALKLMDDYAITSLFVIDAENKAMGIIRLHDLLRAGIV